MGGLYRAGAAARDGITEGKSLLCAHVLLRLIVGERASKLWRDYHEEVNHSDGVRGPVLFRPDESRHGRENVQGKGKAAKDVRSMSQDEQIKLALSAAPPH